MIDRKEMLRGWAAFFLGCVLLAVEYHFFG